MSNDSGRENFYSAEYGGVRFMLLRALDAVTWALAPVALELA